MYPVAFEADFVEKRSRLSTFFRPLLVIPWVFVSIFWSIGAFVCVVLAWFAIVATGSYPRGLYDFVGKALRFTTRVNGFYYLMTDRFPSFGGEEGSDYPVRLVIPAPQERYSRWKTGLRIIIAIPVMIVVYLMGLLVGIVGFLSWIVIVIIGRDPQGLFDVMRLGLAYMSRANAYFLLVTETYPPFSEDEGATASPAAPIPPAPPAV
ncbi:MAG: DUF4389 domain-containing protein [Conexibacter sp.]